MHLVGAIFIFLLLAHFAGERKALKQMRMPFFIRWKLRQQAEKNEVDKSTNCDFKCICQMVGKSVHCFLEMAFVKNHEYFLLLGMLAVPRNSIVNWMWFKRIVKKHAVFAQSKAFPWMWLRMYLLHILANRFQYSLPSSKLPHFTSYIPLYEYVCVCVELKVKALFSAHFPWRISLHNI